MTFIRILRIIHILLFFFFTCKRRSTDLYGSLRNLEKALVVDTPCAVPLHYVGLRHRQVALIVPIFLWSTNRIIFWIMYYIKWQFTLCPRAKQLVKDKSPINSVLNINSYRQVIFKHRYGVSIYTSTCIYIYTQINTYIVIHVHRYVRTT